MKIKNKKIISMMILAVMVMVFVAGCSESPKESPTAVSTGDKSEVVATINGEDITRAEIGEELVAAEKAVVENYVNSYLLKDYYKDIEITDIELEAQFTIIKGQIGETQWPSYLDYIGVKDEDGFKELIKEDLKARKKRDELKVTLEVTDEEIEEHYNEFKSSFDLIVGKMVFFDTPEEFIEGKTLFEAGRTLDELSATMGKDVYENEHVSFEYEGFEVPMVDIKVGDTVYTIEDSGTLAIMTVVKIDNTFEVLQEEVKEELLNQKAQEQVNTDLQTYYDESKVTILGEEIQ